MRKLKPRRRIALLALVGLAALIWMAPMTLAFTDSGEWLVTWEASLRTARGDCSHVSDTVCKELCEDQQPMGVFRCMPAEDS